MRIRDNGEIDVEHADMCHTSNEFWASPNVDRIITIINRKTRLSLTKDELKVKLSAFQAAREVFEQLPLVTRIKEFKKIQQLLDSVEEEVRQKDEKRKANRPR